MGIVDEIRGLFKKKPVLYMRFGRRLKFIQKAKNVHKQGMKESNKKNISKLKPQ